MATKVRPAQSYAPYIQGCMSNGKLSVTVASSNITVAIKTLAGSDPSTTDPVYIRIGDTVRSITAALSVTKNAGTNWFNSGATGSATQEIDYFAYIGYNATDGVVIGFARIPYATKYGDFSATTTNDRYCAISTITTAASTDYYEVVGRFAATLSATASFNWSVPTYTALNLIQRPIFATRMLAFTGSFSGWSSTSGSFYYIIDYNRCFLMTTVEAVGGTSNATTKSTTLPIGINSSVNAGDWSTTCGPIQDNTSWQSASGHIRIETGVPGTMKIGKTAHLAAWTGSGSATFGCDFYYPL